MSSRVTVLLAAVLVAGTGCGDDDGGSGQLSSGEREQAQVSTEAIRDYCRNVAAFLAGRRERPNAAEGQATLSAADRLIGLARSSPDAVFQGGQSMRDLVGDLAEDLEGTNCSGALVRRLNDGLDSIPPRKTVPSY